MRLARGPAGADQPVWHPMMTSVALLAMAAMLMIAPFDGMIIRLVVYDRIAPTFSALALITDAAKSTVYIIGSLLIVCIIGLLDWRSMTRRVRQTLMLIYGRAFFVLIAIIGPGIAINIVKQFVGRGRPRTLEEFGPYVFRPFDFDYLFQSWPSGHSTTAGSLAMILMLWYPQARWIIAAAFIILASARVAANAHYPSDVIAGVTIGMLATLALSRWLARRRTVFRLVPGETMPKLINP